MSSSETLRFAASAARKRSAMRFTLRPVGSSQSKLRYEGAGLRGLMIGLLSSVSPIGSELAVAKKPIEGLTPCGSSESGTQQARLGAAPAQSSAGTPVP